MALFKQHKTARFLCISFLAQFLPWTLISRCTFLYHYFPSVPFLVLMIGFTLTQMHKKIRPQIFYPLCVVYCVAVIAMFVMFYPVITGTPVSGEYVSTYLRWMDSWVLIIQQ
jgi:dolichyl-phosphate-mannose--protein O-mannosyl transferase